MRRRSNRDGGSTKTRADKAATPKRRHASKSARHRSSATASDTELARRTRERDEALEQFSATSAVLKVISGSAGELEPIFRAMLDNATRICEATSGLLVRVEDDDFRIVASLHPIATKVYTDRRYCSPRALPFCSKCECSKKLLAA
jgi:hypothetical protein